MMSVTDPWGTVSGPPIRETLRKRALKREIEYRGIGTGGSHMWVVFGNEKLGDQYAEYLVAGEGLAPDDYSCECQSHGGGQYRRRCSHIVRAIIWWEENGGEIEQWEEKMREGGEGAQGGSGEVRMVSESFVHDPPGTMEAELKKLAEGSASGREGKERENEPYVDEDDVDAPEPYIAPTTLAGRMLEEVGEQGLDIFDINYVNTLTSPQPPLPAKFTEFRPNQAQAILECVEAFESGIKVVFLSAPTGSGKTLLGETVGRFFGSRTYTCTTKSLQAQILRDFDYAKLLMGRANYQTLDNPETDCSSCTKNYSESACWTCGESSGRGHCAFCHPVRLCPYAVAKNGAAAAHLSVLNTAYLIREMRGYRSAFTNQPLYILDEADALEEQLMGFVEVELGPRTRKQLGVGLPDLKGKEESWVEWVESQVLPAAELRVASLKSTLFTMQPDPKEMKKLDQAEALVERLKWLLAPISLDDDSPNLSIGWVMHVDGQKGRWKKGGGGSGSDADITITFKPIKVDRFVDEILWSKGPRFLLMSATLISPSQMAEDLGLERDEWTVVEVESSFPIERRPIVVKGVAALTKKTEDEALPMMVEAVNEIMEAHPKERVLIHTVTYKNTEYLKRELDDRGRLYWYGYSGEREEKLARFLRDPNGVMLAPSFERGIDLHGDDCRVVVILKAPYPYLGDEQIKARLYRTGVSGKRWYKARTIRDICQMTGRAMRSEDDWAISYILDSQFNKLYRENRAMFPGWWSEAVVWDVNDPKWRQALADIYEGRL